MSRLRSHRTAAVRRNPSRSMPPGPTKSAASGSASASASRASAAACIVAIVARNASSGGVRVQPANSSSSAASSVAATPRSGRSAALPASGAYAPIERKRLSGTLRCGGGMQVRRSIIGSGCMDSERPWLASYPEGIPAEIDLDKYPSIVSVLDEAIATYGGNPAFANFGKRITYADVDRLSAKFAGYLLHELKLKKGDRVALMM